LAFKHETVGTGVVKRRRKNRADEREKQHAGIPRAAIWKGRGKTGLRELGLRDPRWPLGPCMIGLFRSSDIFGALIPPSVGEGSEVTERHLRLHFHVYVRADRILEPPSGALCSDLGI
jgi:hypothetical protein